MQFAHTHGLIFRETNPKTQTRRIWKDNWSLTTDKYGTKQIITDPVLRSCTRNYEEFHEMVSTIVYQVGKTYAVQPGRGKPANGRIRVVDLREERVQDITEADAVAEGLSEVRGPLGKIMWEYARLGGQFESPRACYRCLWDSIHGKTLGRWADNPPVGVIVFEVAEPATAGESASSAGGAG